MQAAIYDTRVHVLYVIDSLASGGAERSLAELVPQLVSAGLTLDVAYLFERPGLRSEFIDAGAHLFPRPGSRRFQRIRAVGRLIRERRPDLVHTTLFEADLAGRVAAVGARVPVVGSLVSVPYGPEQLTTPGLRPWKLAAARSLDAMTARSVVAFHAVSRHVAEVMAPRLHIRPKRIHVIPRGRDPGKLGVRSPERGAAVRDRLQLSGDRVILAVARQEYPKGLDVLLQALPHVLRRFPGATALVAGRKGLQTGALRTLADQLALGGAIRFLGPRTDIPDLLSAADVLVAPSRWEGFPNAIAEAMALEAPIVASDLPAVREVVGDGQRALLTPPGDPGALASAIEDVLKNPSAARGRAERARDRFLERYTSEIVARQMVTFYEQALRI